MNKKNKLSGIIWFLLHGYAQTRSSTQSRRRSSIECFNGAENVVASLQVGPLVQLVEHVVRSFVRWFAANVNVQTQLKLICPSIGIASSPLLPLVARRMFIYAHIFVDNLRDLIARRAAANCCLVRQLICQKIDGPLGRRLCDRCHLSNGSLSIVRLPRADFGLVCRCRNFHLDRLPNCCKVKFALCLLQCPEV